MAQTFETIVKSSVRILTQSTQRWAEQIKAKEQGQLQVKQKTTTSVLL